MSIMQSAVITPVEKTYEQHLRHLALESIAMPSGPSILAVLKQIVPRSSELLSSLLPNLSRLSDHPEVPPLNNRERRELLVKLQKVPYMAYQETLIFVPEGFKGKWIPYLELLLSQGDMLLARGKEVVDNYNLELSKFLSNADVRHSLVDKKAEYSKLKAEREGYQKLVDKFFDQTNSTLSRQKLKVVIDRFSDLSTVFQLEEKLLAVRKRQDYKTIIGEVNRASEMLKLISRRLDKGDIEDVSGQVARNLAEGAYEVAKFVEYLAIFGYYMETILASIHNTAEMLGQQT